MPQKFLSLRNFDKYQTYKHANAPWFKIQHKIFGDRDFINLPITLRYLAIGLIHLACETNNKIYNDRTWIGQRLYMKSTEINLTPLYRCGFLNTSNLSRTLSEEFSIGQDSTGEESVDPPPPVSKPEIPLPDDWTPKDHHARFAVARGLDLKIEAQHFCGKAQELEWVTKDWDRKFSNWMLQEVKYRQRRQG